MDRQPHGSPNETAPVEAHLSTRREKILHVKMDRKCVPNLNYYYYHYYYLMSR